jgi:Transglutaminase-like superfamily
MVLLVLAKFLIHHVRFGWWRASLGAVGKVAQQPTSPAIISHVVGAVFRATQRLSGDYVCLPRAMAVQWMLARRGTPSTLVFGIARDMGQGQLHDLHAWVEVGGVIVIGAMPERDYVRGLTLIQP